MIKLILKAKKMHDQLKMGIKVESEHTDVYDYFEKYLKQFNVSMPFEKEKLFEMIAKVHVKELSDYYTRLKEMEK